LVGLNGDSIRGKAWGEGGAVRKPAAGEALRTALMVGWIAVFVAARGRRVGDGKERKNKVRVKARVNK